MIYVKVSDDRYAPLTTSYASVLVVVSGPQWDVKFGADIISSHNNQQEARDAAAALVHKLGAVVEP